MRVAKGLKLHMTHDKGQKKKTARREMWFVTKLFSFAALFIQGLASLFWLISYLKRNSAQIM